MKLNRYVFLISILSIILVSGRIKNEKLKNKNYLLKTKGNNSTKKEESLNKISTRSKIDESNEESDKLRIEKTHDLFFPSKNAITEEDPKNKNTTPKKTIYNLSALIKSEEGEIFLQNLRNTQEFINEEKTLVYNGPLTIYCDECEKEFQSISLTYSKMYKSFDNMQGIGMKCDSPYRTYCELYQISKVPYIPKDTEIAFIDFLESEKKFVGMILIYLPLSPCSICLSEIEIRMKNKNDVLLHVFYIDEYKKLLLPKIKQLKMNQRPIIKKIFDLGEPEDNYLKVLSKGMKNTIFTKIKSE